MGGAEKRKRQAAEPEVDFGSLHMNTLKRYKKHYKLQQDTSNKAELVEVVSSHFSQQTVVELETVLLFIHMIKTSRNAPS